MKASRQRIGATILLAAAWPFAGVALAGCSAAGGNAAGGSHVGSNATSNSSSGGSGLSPAAGSSAAGSASLTLDVDASAPDDDAATGCTHLNIGIFGNPGSNDASNFEQWLTKSGTSVSRIQTTADESMTNATLAPFDVVVLDCLPRDYTADEAAVFGAWVSAGGGVAAMSGYHNDTTVDWHANSLLAPLRVAYSGSLLSGPVTTFATHPITAGMTSVTFEGGYGISDLGGVASTRTPIAFLPGTPEVTVGLAVQMGSGRAFVWGDEWIEFDSEWTTLPEIPQLWVQAFAWISPTTKCALDPPR
jgi:hypothetical protein